MLNITVVALEHSMESPQACLGDPLMSVQLCRPVRRVPVVHVFGYIAAQTSTLSASTVSTLPQKCAPSDDSPNSRPPSTSTPAPTALPQAVCLHVHGVFPYFYVPYHSAAGSPAAFAALLEAAATSALRLPPDTRLVHRVVAVQAVPFYGYHAGPRLFLKIFCYNPNVVPRLVNVLGSTRLVGGRRWQPYEGHVPYQFQFMLDFGVSGMGTVACRRALVRQPLPLPSSELPGPFPPAPPTKVDLAADLSAEAAARAANAPAKIGIGRNGESDGSGSAARQRSGTANAFARASGGLDCTGASAAGLALGPAGGVLAGRPLPPGVALAPVDIEKLASRGTVEFDVAAADVVAGEQARATAAGEALTDTAVRGLEAYLRAEGGVESAGAVLRAAVVGAEQGIRRRATCASVQRGDTMGYAMHQRLLELAVADGCVKATGHTLLSAAAVPQRHSSTMAEAGGSRAARPRSQGLLPLDDICVAATPTTPLQRGVPPASAALHVLEPQLERCGSANDPVTDGRRWADVAGNVAREASDGGARGAAAATVEDCGHWRDDPLPPLLAVAAWQQGMSAAKGVAPPRGLFPGAANDGVETLATTDDHHQSDSESERGIECCPTFHMLDRLRQHSSDESDQSDIAEDDVDVDASAQSEKTPPPAFDSPRHRVEGTVDRELFAASTQATPEETPRPTATKAPPPPLRLASLRPDDLDELALLSLDCIAEESEPLAALGRCPSSSSQAEAPLAEQHEEGNDAIVAEEENNTPLDRAQVAQGALVVPLAVPASSAHRNRMEDSPPLLGPSRSLSPSDDAESGDCDAYDVPVGKRLRLESPSGPSGVGAVHNVLTLSERPTALSYARCEGRQQVEGCAEPNAEETPPTALLCSALTGHSVTILSDTPHPAPPPAPPAFGHGLPPLPPHPFSRLGSATKPTAAVATLATSASTAVSRAATAFLRFASVEVVAHAPVGKVAAAEVHPLLAIGVAFGDTTHDDIVSLVTLAVGACGSASATAGARRRVASVGGALRMFESEALLLKGFVSLIQSLDPDVLLSWDAQKTGLGFVVERCRLVLCLDLLATLGRLLPKANGVFSGAAAGGGAEAALEAKLRLPADDGGGGGGSDDDGGGNGESSVKRERDDTDAPDDPTCAAAFAQFRGRFAARFLGRRAGGTTAPPVPPTAAAGVADVAPAATAVPPVPPRRAFALRIPGRIIISLWKLVKSELKQKSYTLQAVHASLCGRPLPLFADGDLAALFLGSPSTSSHASSSGFVPPLPSAWVAMRALADRTVAPLRIARRLDLFVRTSEMAQLYGILFFEVLSRGSQFRVESALHRCAKPLGFVMVSPSREQVMLQNRQEGIPLVMEPFSAYYTDPVIVLDFRSLYPSIVIAYNLCFSTCLGKMSTEPFVKLGAITGYRIPSSVLARHAASDINIAPNSCMFVRSTVRKGVLPEMLARILDTRFMVQAVMKRAASVGDTKHERVFDAQQTALKLLANVTYGYTAATFTGRMPCSDVADSIVLLGRQTLERAMRTVAETPEWGARVVYGDTDSMFVCVPGATRERAFDVGEAIVKAVTAANPAPIALKLEKVYQPCMLLTKKRYVGYAYEKRTQREPKFDAKGIETVRRDQCAATSKVCEALLRTLFDTGDVARVQARFQDVAARVRSGDVDPTDLILRREVKLGTYASETSLPPGARVALRMIASDSRCAPLYGERVPYLVLAAPTSKLRDMVAHPQRLLSDVGGGAEVPRSSPLMINGAHYMEKHIVPSLLRMFHLVKGADIARWDETAPRARRHDALFNLSVLGVAGPAMPGSLRCDGVAAAAVAAAAAAVAPAATGTAMDAFCQNVTCCVCRSRRALPVGFTVSAASSATTARGAAGSAAAAAASSGATADPPVCARCLSRPRVSLRRVSLRAKATADKLAALHARCRRCIEGADVGAEEGASFLPPLLPPAAPSGPSAAAQKPAATQWGTAGARPTSVAFASGCASADVAASLCISTDCPTTFAKHRLSDTHRKYGLLTAFLASHGAAALEW